MHSLLCKARSVYLLDEAVRTNVQNSNVNDHMGVYVIIKDQFNDVIAQIVSKSSFGTKEFHFTPWFRENLLWQKSGSWQGKVIVPRLKYLGVSCKYSAI